MKNPFNEETIFICPGCYNDIQCNNEATLPFLSKYYKEIITKSIQLQQFPSVESIQKTPLSIFIEGRINEVIVKERRRIAKQNHMEYEDVDYPHDLSIRVVLNEVFFCLDNSLISIMIISLLNIINGISRNVQQYIIISIGRNVFVYSKFLFFSSIQY